MNSSQKNALDQLDHVWMNHVRDDYFIGNLTYGEQVVHASISHHLRNHLRNLSDFRVWHEVRIDAINPSLKKTHRMDGRAIDIVLAFVDTKDLTEETKHGAVPLDLSEVTNVQLFAAIEIKYAPYGVRGRRINIVEDIEKLVIIREEYLPNLHLLFALIPGTEQINLIDEWKEEISKKSIEHSFSFLFGHPTESEGWTVEHYP